MKPKTLIADDMLGVRQEIDEYLRLEGFEVVHAVSGKEALERLDASFSAAILDVKMASDTDGMEALCQIRKRVDLRHLCVIVLTGYGAVGQAVEAMHIGADNYVQKPIELPLLVAILRTGIAKKQADDLLSRIVRGANPSDVINDVRQIIASAMPTAAHHIHVYSKPQRVEGPPAGEEIGPYKHDILSPAGWILGRVEVDAGEAKNRADCDSLIRNLAGLIEIAIQLHEQEIQIREGEQQRWKEVPVWLAAIKDRIANPAQTIGLQIDNLAAEEQKIEPTEDRAELARRIAIIRRSSMDIQVACEFLNKVPPVVAISKRPINIINLLNDRIHEAIRNSADFDVEPTFDQNGTLSLICPIDEQEIGAGVSALIRNSREAIIEKRRSILQPGPVATPDFITVRLRDRGPEGIEIRVEDSGIGISEENKGKIFKPLFTTKRRVDNHGYELFHTKRVVEAHGGEIGFESTYGVGTKFTVRLPGSVQSWPNDSH